MEPNTLLNGIFLTAAEFFALAALFGGLAFVLTHLVRAAGRLPVAGRVDLARAQRLSRTGLLLLFLVSAAALLIFNASLMLQGRDVRAATVELITTTMPPGFWQRLGIGVALTAGMAFLARYGLRLLSRALPWAQRQVRRVEAIQISDERLSFFFRLLDQTIGIGVWLFVAISGAGLLGLPAVAGETLAVALRIFLIVQAGRMLVGMLGSIINTLDALSETYLRNRELDLFYDHLRGLIPLLSRAVQYIIYVQAISLALAQIAPLAGYAGYGTRIIQAIGIVFLGLVLIEVLKLLINTFYLVRGELSAAQWQQRLTFAPVMKSAAQYVVMFGGGLLILATLGFDIGPILVALGGLSLVVGLAAQPVTTDLISGLFILFENLFLVGDYIETGEARGVVEMIDVRTTRIRDPDGQLHLVRNGQIGSIVNYSKGYVYAVVMISVSADTNLDQAFAVIRQVGQELDVRFEEVLEPTLIQGIEEFGNDTVLIRTLTRVKPGCHQQMSRELRLMIKLAFEREGIAMDPEPPVVVAARQVLLSSRAIGVERQGQ
ncbi:MAG: mechanosensitive ion channel family protein [Chloroflexales bacterium]|nr:mechanosensitive ion channel family protein [Chloroflexales bacterium]